VSIDTQTLDAVMISFAWLLGASLGLIAASGVGFVFWWAQAMERPGLAKITIRAALSWLSIAVAVVAGMSLAIGLEASLGYPFGASSGGLVLWAYVLGLALGTRELATSFALLHRRAEREDSGLGRAMAAMTAATGVFVWASKVVMQAVAGLVTFVMLFGDYLPQG